MLMVGALRCDLGWNDEEWICRWERGRVAVRSIVRFVLRGRINPEDFCSTDAVL